MKIWVDADACPGEVKEVIMRAAERLEVHAIFVANKVINHPRFRFVSAVRVSQGLDVADSYIVQSSESGDVCITGDIPLAAELVAKGVIVIDRGGELYTLENIRERLSMRDFMQGLREAGTTTGGPRPFDAKTKQRFAAALDKVLAKAVPKKQTTPT